MNFIFTTIVIASAVALCFVNPDAVMSSLLEGAGSGATFALKLFCIYAVWLSVLNMWSGLKFDAWLGRRLRFFTKKLFPKENDVAYNYLSINLSANLLGMGSAGTPAGLSAMENLQSKKNRIMLVVINSTSIQIIPTTILAMRSSVNAASDILLPSIIATFFTTAIGIILVELLVKK